MAEYAGVSRWQVHQIWKAADLKPHRLKTFKISNDPDFAEKVFGGGGTRFFYKLLGVAICFIGIMLITNLFGNFMIWLFGGLFG